MNTIIVYGANNSENAYDYLQGEPLVDHWHWVDNVYTKVSTVVSTTDIVAKWIIKLK